MLVQTVRSIRGKPVLSEVPRLGKDHLLTLNSSPTLSYTQKLEQRVAQLEAALSEATKGVNSWRLNHAAGDAVPSQARSSLPPSEIPETHENRTLSLHDSISLFQANSIVRTPPVEARQADQETALKKESLMNSAWRERAYEKLADIPVGNCSSDCWFWSDLQAQEPFRSLLDSHFCWIQPLLNFVYRPAFTR